MNDAPIGVFDSGFGGLTVLREIASELPEERCIFLGDSARCPYGPRPLEEVREYAMQICSWLIDRGCKLIVIACNTATAAALSAAQKEFSVPIVGVVEPGARAASRMTRTRKVGVIATEGTVRSDAYAKAICHYDSGIEVFSLATPSFVEMAEGGLNAEEPGSATASEVYETLAPLLAEDIDTLVMGCTHFPLISGPIADAAGPSVSLVSSAEETARDVAQTLSRRGDASSGYKGSEGARIEYFTTGEDVDGFKKFGELVMGAPLAHVRRIEL